MHAATTTGRENTRFPTQRAAQGNAGQALLSNVTFLLSANDAGTSSCRVESLTITSRSHQTWLIATERHVFCTCFSSHHCICSLCGALSFPDHRSLTIVCASVTLRIRLRWLTVLDVDPTFCSFVLANSAWCADGNYLSYSYALHKASSPPACTPVQIQRHG
jgi:hypothetical protein